MSFYDAIRVGASGASGYEVERSLRFNDGDSPWLERTVSSSSNRRTFTISAWVKRSKLGIFPAIFGQTDTSGSYMFYMVFDTNDQIYIIDYDYPSNNYHFITNRRFRDLSAWYHIVLAVDTTQATNTNRSKLYVNGVQETSFGTANYPAQNLQTFVNHTTYPVRIGRHGWGHTQYMDGYMAEYNFIDGLQLTPSSFGETDAITGQWNPKKYVGSYGTNGFYLNFSDNSGTTATTLGKDSSGNGNNFTPNNFSVAANLTNDSMPDTPTNNFCTLNPLNATSSFNFNIGEGNLVFDQSSNDQAITGTFFITSGKWYWEIYKNASQNPEIGICGQETLSNQSTGTVNSRLAFITNDGNLRTGASSTQSITGSSSGQTGAGYIRIAVDMDNKKIWFSDTSGNYFNSGNPATGANAAYDFSSHPVKDGWTPYVFMGTGSGHNCYINFGQFDLNSFSSNIPAGFSTLTSANLPDPTILLPNKHFDTLLYTGNGSTNNITGLNFSPDWVWGKTRNTSAVHYLFDQVRGVNKYLDTQTDAETTSQTDLLTAFNSDGFTLGANAGSKQVNKNGNTYVAWNWDAGETDSATYTVKVVSDSGNKYRFNDFGTSAVTLDLAEGGTYTFDQSDSSMSSHPMQLSTTANGTHGGGSAYSTGVTYELDGSTVTASAFISGFSSASSRKLIITVAASAPTLYYYCYYHSGMGGAINTNSTLGSSNFAGSRQATTKVNATAGFSIVTSTSGGSSSGTYDSFGHGLGVAPNVIIFKNRDISDNWGIYNSNFSTAYSKILQFNTNAETTSSNYWGTANPSSTTFSLNQGSVFNGADEKLVAYCFSEVEGYSKFGKYTGNGNADGTFVFTGLDQLGYD